MSLTIEECADLVKDGATIAQIAARFGCSEMTVSRRIRMAKHLGLLPEGGPGKLTPEQVAEIRELYMGGLGYARIGRMFSVSPMNVKYHVFDLVGSPERARKADSAKEQ